MVYRKFIILILCGGLLLPIGAVAPTVRADGPVVVINELMWMGSSASSADEWIELRNLTDQVINVAGWTLTKKSSGAEVPMLTIPVGKSILPGSIFVISNYVNTSTSSALDVAPDYVTTDVALSNSALQIKLYDAARVLIDTADDGVGNPLSGNYDSSKKLYATMERNPTPGDGTQAQSWHSASRGVGYKPGAIELGTPGAQNSNGIPAAHAGSDQAGIAGQEINFDASDSSDPENQPLTYTWTFGDDLTAVEATPKHVYAAAGVYTAMLTVSDGTDSTSDEIKVTITAAPAVVPVITTPVTTPSPSSLEEGTVAPAAAPVTSCLGLHISELYPNPPGVDNDEFIELVNNGDEEITTGTCTVFTTATRSYKIPAGQVIARGAFLVLPKTQTKLTLNNGGTTVRLVDSDGTELDRVEYGIAKEAMSWALFADGWAWTNQTTSGAVNVLVKTAVKVTGTTNTSTNSATKTKKTTAAKKTPKPEVPAEKVTLKEIQELDSGDRVVVRGVVTVPRDVLGSTVAYIQSEDSGVSMTIPNGEKIIKIGQNIEATGTVRLKNGRRYVAVAAKSLKVLSTVPLPLPPTVATDDISADQADQLVHVKGVVSLASGSRIEIDDGSGPVVLYLKSSTGIVRPKVKAGDTVDAVGIVSISTSGIRILPRAQEDFRVERVLGASTVIPAQAVTAPAASRMQTVWYWSLVATGGLAAGAKPMWRAIKKGRNKQ